MLRRTTTHQNRELWPLQLSNTLKKKLTGPDRLHCRAECGLSHGAEANNCISKPWPGDSLSVLFASGRSQSMHAHKMQVPSFGLRARRRQAERGKLNMRCFHTSACPPRGAPPTMSRYEDTRRTVRERPSSSLGDGGVLCGGQAWRAWGQAADWLRRRFRKIYFKIRGVWKSRDFSKF